MSENFTLDLVNPAVTSPPTSVVYTGLDGGNALNLVLGNDFGFDLQIGGGSTVTCLVVRVAAGIIDASGAAALAASAPWSIASHDPPAAGRAAAQQFWTFNLQPPPGGVAFPNGGSATIALTNLQPSAAGNGLVTAYYQFDSDPADDLKASAALSVIGTPDPDWPRLIGDSAALRPTIYVNGGAMSNPIMVSAGTVTEDTAVTNAFHLNLLLQGNAPLVTGWNALHPPSLRIFFPCFSPYDRQAAVWDLTDSFQPGDQEYNAFTSAWNIQGSLDPTNPEITSDTFWQVAFDPRATTPTWLVTPTPQNTSLFTSVQSSASEPGPFFDVYLSSIVSALPIDTDHPETTVSIQWNDFPGFNDGVAVCPLQKTTLAITSFGVRVDRAGEGPQLHVHWDTIGADHCRLNGERRDASEDSATTVSVGTPLCSSYTLTAVGPDGRTEVSRTLSAQWRLDATVAPAQVDQPYQIQVTPDARWVLALCGGTPRSVVFFEPDTLAPRGVSPLGTPNHVDAGAFAVAPGGRTLYLLGDDNVVSGYDLDTLLLLPATSAPVPGLGPPNAQITVSADGANVVVVTSASVDPQAGLNQLVLLDSTSLQPAAGSPVALNDLTAAVVLGPSSGRYYLGGADGVTVLDPSTYANVLGSPVAVARAGAMAVAPDESSLYALSVSDSQLASALVKIDGTTLLPAIQLPVDTFLFSVNPVNLMQVPRDGATLFVVGPSYTAFLNGQLVSRLCAYDAATLQEHSWSPLSFGGRMPNLLAISPDGSRIFAAAADPLTTTDPPTYVFAIDPVFA